MTCYHHRRRGRTPGRNYKSLVVIYFCLHFCVFGDVCGAFDKVKNESGSPSNGATRRTHARTRPQTIAPRRIIIAWVESMVLESSGGTGCRCEWTRATCSCDAGSEDP